MLTTTVGKWVVLVLLLVGGVVALIFSVTLGGDPRLRLLAKGADRVGDHAVTNCMNDLVVAVDDGVDLVDGDGSATGNEVVVGRGVGEV